MDPRIQRLKDELERLQDTAESCHPDLRADLLLLIEDMRAHLSELEAARPADETD